MADINVTVEGAQPINVTVEDSQPINVTIEGGTGETNTMSNVGGENEVFKQKTSADFELRTLKAGTNVTIVQNADDIEISSADVVGAVDSVFSRTGAVVAQAGDYSSSDVGLGNVDNTSDLNKPISTATQTALDGKADTSDVLELDNTTPFTPDADYEPATKKYVDDSVLTKTSRYLIWAEENGNLNAATNGGKQWAFGNGATSNIGITVPHNCTVVSLTHSSQNTVTAQISIQKNGASVGSISPSAATSTVVTGLSISYSQGDKLNFITDSGSGGTQNIICAEIEVDF